VLLAALLLAPAAAAQDGAALMAQLEARLLAARHIAIEAVVESSGPVAARLQGRSALLDRNRATWAYTGTFAGAPADLALVADGRFVRLRNGEQRSEVVAGRDSNRALLLGLTRMGLLHNLARLAGLRAPDHAEGGIEQWVVLDSFRPVTFPQGGELAGTLAVGFDLVVEGTDSGSARLWFDPDSGLPRRRQQSVRLPQGEMTVVETYTRFEVR
jgi:hypothetical protein